MICHELCPVIANLAEAPHSGWAALLSSIDSTSPGYVKLRVIKDGLLLTESDGIEDGLNSIGKFEKDRCGDYFWKNSPSVVDEKVPLKRYQNGPAHTFIYGNTYKASFDQVFSLRCRTWPTFANEWITRIRYHNWPSKHIIDKFRKLGFFVVKVGHPHSIDRGLEWRVSFSLQERQLMFDLTDVQHKCYVMLKLIKHNLIERTIGKSITSYHCKTCIFYAIEKNSKTIWVLDNLFACVMKCLQILLDWTKKGVCPNYFIPDENMFDNKVYGKKRQDVIDILENILADSSFFIKIQNGQFGNYFIYKDNDILIKELEKRSCVENLTLMSEIQNEVLKVALEVANSLLHFYLSQNDKSNSDVCSGSNLLLAIDEHRELIAYLINITTITEHTSVETKESIDLLLPFIHTSLACHLVSFVHYSKTVPLCSTSSVFRHEFEKGVLSDLTSGRLKCYTCLYSFGMYRACAHQLVLLEKRLKPHVIPLSSFRRTEKCPFKIKLNKSDKYILQNNISACVLFLPTEIPIIPNALKFEMFRSAGTLPESRTDAIDHWHDWAVLDSKVYMYFLWYLVARQMKLSVNKRVYLIEKLKLSSNTSLIHQETAFNLVAWVLILEDCIYEALTYLMLSWVVLKKANLMEKQQGQRKEHQMQHNAAKWHMLLFLHKVWVSQKASDNEQISCFCFKCFMQKDVRLKICSGCRIAKYCSKDCQKKNWNLHRNICELVA